MFPNTEALLNVAFDKHTGQDARITSSLGLASGFFFFNMIKCRLEIQPNDLEPLVIELM